MIDQFGYRRLDNKVAVLVNPQVGYNSTDFYVPGKELQVRCHKDDSLVFCGSPVIWNGGSVCPSSGDQGWWFDFSQVQTTGKYYIYDTDNDCQSYPFRIADDVYDDVLKAALKIFYYQRLGTSLDHRYAGEHYADEAAFIGYRQDLEARSVSN